MRDPEGVWKPSRERAVRSRLEYYTMPLVADEVS